MPDLAPATEETLMKIHVNRVPPEGLRERATYDPAALDMERDDIRLLHPFEAEVFASLADRELVVEVGIRSELRMTCARCLEPFEATLTPRALFTYSVQPADVVDITDDVRQEVMLAYPMAPLCRSGCKGLCRFCGQNLNAGACGHEAAEAR
jgi:uncharacterized protein